MKEDNIDKLIDSAFSKDIQSMEILDPKPDQSLLSSLNFQTSAGTDMSIKAGKTLLTSGLLKLGLAILFFGGGVVAYFVYSAPSIPTRNVNLLPTDSIINRQQKIDTPIANLVAPSEKQEIKKANNKADSIEVQKSYHSQDMIPAQSTKFKTDSTIKFQIKE
jgi:hypothetical protein